MWDSTFPGEASFRGWRALLAALVLGGCSDVGDSLSAVGADPLRAPSGLSASALPGGMQVILSWIDNSSGETGFRIDVNGAPFGTTPTVVDVIEVPADSTSHVYDTWPGRTLYFRVLAVTTDLESEPSGVVSVTTPEVPLPPGDLRAAAVSPVRIDLSWGDVAGETGYRVERSIDSGLAWSPVGSTGAGATAFQDVGLSPDMEYRYRVIAFNAHGDSLPSNVARAVTQTAAVMIRAAASAGEVGRWPSLRLYGATEYISHYDLGNGDCLLTYGSPTTGYTTVGLDGAGGDVGWGTALALDAGGYYHVVAFDRTHADLRYMTNNPASPYSIVTVESAGSVGAYPRIAVSPKDGTVHAVYLQNLEGPDQLRHAVRTYDGSWTIENVLSVPYYVVSFDLAVDAAGRPHLSMSRSLDGGAYELVHAVRSGDSWNFTVITNKDQPQDNSIAIGPDGGPHVAYYAGGIACQLRHAEEIGGAWITKVVHEGPDVGRANSIAVHGGSGRIHVAYYDSINRDLRYARKDPGASWVLRLIDSEGDVGSFTDVAVDAAGWVHIAYRDETNRDLKVALGVP